MMKKFILSILIIILMFSLVVSASDYNKKIINYSSLVQDENLLNKDFSNIKNQSEIIPIIIVVTSSVA